MTFAYSLTYGNNNREKKIIGNSIMISINADLTPKWKTGISTGYDFVQNYQPTDNDFNDNEQLIVFQILHAIAESLLFDHEIRVVATKQNFELAALLRDLKKDALQAFTQNGKENQVVIPFFSFNNKVLTLKFVDNYFINQTIRERLRL